MVRRLSTQSFRPHNCLSWLSRPHFQKKKEVMHLPKCHTANDSKVRIQTLDTVSQCAWWLICFFLNYFCFLKYSKWNHLRCLVGSRSPAWDFKMMTSDYWSGNINRWAIRVRCEMLVGLNIACGGLDCWFILPRGALPWDVTAKPSLLWGMKLRPWLLLGGGKRWKASMKSTHTPFPNGWKLATIMSSNSCHWRLYLNYENLSGAWLPPCNFLKFTLMMSSKPALRSHLAGKWKAFVKTFEPTA